MSEISLKEYFAKLNSLLNMNSADEVIHHCRHILQYFPKNVTAYRDLGRALVINGRWEEGREALRRVLSVIPDDYTAHLSLSEANERMNRPDEAIWHLERAFEQRPNDKELIDALRGLYRQYRHVDNLKVQLTSASVARQYLRSGAYSQAIDSLRTALARMSERLDLKLLLAQILWQNNSEEEAAEIALEVLKVLPDCLEANKIMAQLWLGVDRPSDAQRYVNHLEAVDPYLAVELVQGFPAEDDVFRIEELDYTRTSQSELASARPDWLQEISGSSTPTEAETVDVAPAGSNGGAPKVEDQAWTNWASAMLSNNKKSGEAEKPAANQSTTSRFAAIKKEQEPVRSGGLTDLFGKVDDSNSDELSALFEAGENEADDPMAWLRDTNVQIAEDQDEQPSYNNLFADDLKDSPVPDAEDPMAWLQGSNDDLRSALANGDSALEEDDSMSWMQDPTFGDASDNDTEADAVGVDDNALSWLSDDNLLDDAFGAESLTAGDANTEAQPWDQAAFARDEQEEPAPAAVQQGVPGVRRGLTAMLQDKSFDWTKELKDDKVENDAEMDEWLNQFGPAEPRKPVSDTPDWLTQLDQPQAGSGDEWLSGDDDDSDKIKTVGWGDTDTAEPEADSEDWLAEFGPETEKAQPDDEFAWSTPTPEPEAEESNVPDWLSGSAPNQDAQKLDVPNSEEFPWMSQDTNTGSEDEPEEAAEGDAPDWLSALEPDQADEEADAEPIGDSADTEFSWLTDDALAGAEASTESDAVVDDAPDWLSALEPVAAEETELEPAAEASADTEFSWLTDDALAGAEASAENDAVTEDAPDWLSALEPVAAEETEPEAAAVSSADDEFSWLTDDALAGAEASAETDAVTEDAPDWLSALEPVAAEETEPEAAAVSSADDEFAWMTDDALAGAEASAETNAVAEDAPDWLSALEPVAAEETELEPAAEASADDEFAWMTDDALAGAEASAETDAVVEESPDWLSALAPEAAQETEPEAVAASSADDEFAWMTEDALSQAETESESAVAEETPDWLSELEPVEASPEAEPEAVSADAEYSWMNEAQPEASAEPEAEAVAEETPDWLAELAPAEASEEAEPEAVTDPEYTWMADDALSQTETEAESTPESEAVVAEEVPDWLSELEPADASQEAEPEAEPEAVADAEYSWMNEVQPEAEAEPEAEAVSEETPDWLAELEPAEASQEAEPEAVTDPEYSWMAEDALSEAETEAQSTPEAEPDLLAEPVTAQDDQDAEPEAVPEWLAEPEAEPMGLMDEAAEETIADPEFGWMHETEASDETPEPESVETESAEPEEAEQLEPVAEAIGAEFDDQQDIGDNEGESADEYEEALEPSPAQNAPDWLNAMVPGLDVDYEAEQEELEPEEEAVEEPAADEEEFAWVAEMVDEEVAAGERPAYVFSKSPSWLATTNSHAGNGKVDDDLPDWPSDDADADVPEWLR